MPKQTMSIDVPQPPPRPVTVLVVEDDQMVRRFLTEYLERVSGYYVVAAAHVDEALRIVAHRHVDVVIADVRLQPQGESGLEVVAWLRNEPEFQDIPILVLTGVILTPEEEEVIRSARAYVFYKPEGFATLLEYVGRLVGPDRHRH